MSDENKDEPDVLRIIEAARAEVRAWRAAWSDNPEEEMRAELGESLSELMDAVDAYDRKQPRREKIKEALAGYSSYLGNSTEPIVSGALHTLTDAVEAALDE